jgi:hypothetical protein
LGYFESDLFIQLVPLHHIVIRLLLLV